MTDIDIQGQLIAVVLRGNDAAFFWPLLIFIIIFYGPVDVQIKTLLTRRQ